MESLRGCGRALQLPIVGLGSSIDDRTMSNFRRVSASAKIDRAPCLFFVFHSPLHHFKIPQKPKFTGVVVWKNISDAPSIGLSRATSIRKLTATFDSSFGASALALGSAATALHCTCTQTGREYFRKGCKILDLAMEFTEGTPRTVRKTKVRTTPLRSQKCKCH